MNSLILLDVYEIGLYSLAEFWQLRENIHDRKIANDEVESDISITDSLNLT